MQPSGLTWLGHCPLFALKQAARCRQLTNTCPVYCSGTELIEVAFMEVADLEEGKDGLGLLQLGRRSCGCGGGALGTELHFQPLICLFIFILR